MSPHFEKTEIINESIENVKIVKGINPSEGGGKTIENNIKPIVLFPAIEIKSENVHQDMEIVTNKEAFNNFEMTDYINKDNSFAYVAKSQNFGNVINEINKNQQIPMESSKIEEKFQQIEEKTPQVLQNEAKNNDFSNNPFLNISAAQLGKPMFVFGSGNNPPIINSLDNTNPFCQNFK